MLLKLNEPVHIEDMQQYPAEYARRLRDLLLRGAPATADPARKDFFDVEDAFRVFYIHICPSGKVLMLAVWPKEGAPLHARQDAQLAASSAA